jgi:ABC transporter, ATP-binding protein
MKDFRVDHLKKTYGAKTLLADVSFIINEGEHVGLIGQNGTGKSSLLNILAGIDEAESGTITCSNDFRIGYLSQNPSLNPEHTVFEAIYESDNPLLRLVHDYEWSVEQLQQHPQDEKYLKQFEALEQKMNQVDGWQYEVKIKSILQHVGIEDIHQQISTLSGGQKKRVGLAKVLMEEPDLLLLDEPTNHLDMQAIQWLEQYLASYKGSLLLVTHDRYFLERVVDHMFELTQGRIEAYDGNYQSYLEQKSQREQIAQKMSHKQQRLYQQELQWMRQGAKARTTKQQARIQRFEQLEKEVKQTDSKESLAIRFDQTRIGKRVFQLKDVSLQIGDQSIVRSLEWIIQSQSRIGIVGENGVGKSTFLNALAGLYPFSEGEMTVGDTVRLAYYKQQDEDIPMDKQLVQYLREYAEEVRQKNGEVASITELLETFLFPRYMHGALIGTLSGGERRRLYLLRLLMTKPNVLLLDEPTNDLDIDTLTVLEDYLEEFNGAVIVVSHDRYFLDKTMDQLFVIKGQGNTELYYGSMSDFLAKQGDLTVEETKTVEVPKVTETSKASTPEKAKKMTYHEKKEWEEIEGKIAGLEASIEEIQEAMNQQAQDFAKLQELQTQLETLELELANSYERWEYLAELV